MSTDKNAGRDGGGIANAHDGPTDRQGDSRLKRRNLTVLAILTAFVAFAFILSFSHVALESGGATKQTQS